jgi:hypothetical protein
MQIIESCIAESSLNTVEGSIKSSLLRATHKLRFQLAGFTKGKKYSMKQRCDT